jgi:polar amino acid transport system permease protein
MGLCRDIGPCTRRHGTGDRDWDRRRRPPRRPHCDCTLAGHRLCRADQEHAVPCSDLFHFFALPFAGIRINPTPTAIIALGVNGGAYAIEIIRGGVQSISKGQVEAGYALGLRKSQVFRLIILKPALRAIYPSLASQFILLTLTTSIASAVAAYELTSVAKQIENDSFRSFEVYGVVTLLYFIMSWMMMNFLNFIRSRYLSYPVK